MGQENADYAERGSDRRRCPPLRSLAIGGIVIAVILAGGWYGLMCIPGDYGYTVTADFAAVPPDDVELKAWLKAQPGVWNADVSRIPKANGIRIEIFVGMNRDGWGQPPFPDLSGRCAELGYQGQSARWQDIPPPPRPR